MNQFDVQTLTNGLKDYIVPTAALFVSVVVPWITYRASSRQGQRRLAVELFESFNSQDMRHHRRSGWMFMVTDRKRLDHNEQKDRLLQYISHSTSVTHDRVTDAASHAQFVRVTRVLQFFSLVDSCLGRGILDPQMTLLTVGWYYRWWHDEVIRPLRELHTARRGDPKSDPSWLGLMPHLDALCKIAAK